MTDEKKPDGGLAGWIEVLEDDQSGDSELLCLLLELRRHRENGSQARAEAFRALEQENILLKQGCENNPLVHEMIDWRERAEAAEAENKRLSRNYQSVIEQNMPRTGDGCEPGWSRIIEARELQDKLEAAERRAEAAEAKLAELKKQKPVAYMNTREGDPTWPRVFLHQKGAEVNRNMVTLNPMVKTKPLFTRPAPAVSLAELVPDEWTLAQSLKFVDEYAPPSEEEAALFAVNSFRAAILRNIEEKIK